MSAMLPFTSDPDLLALPLLSQKQQSSQGLQFIRRDTLTENPPLDEPLLAVQIGGIVGAYVIFVAIILTLLLVVGRRLRRTVQSSNYTLQVEMMKPKAPLAPSAAASVDPSPITPTNKSHGFRSWTSLAKGAQSHRSNNGSVATIDHESVVDADRRRAQDQMEMLYAAVMAHDEAKAATGGSPISPTDDVSLKDLSPRSPMSYQNPFSDYAQRVPEPQAYPQPQLPQYQSQQTQQSQYHYPAPAPAPGPAAAPAVHATPTSPTRSTASRLSRISNLSLFQSNRDQAAASASQGSKMRSPRFSRKSQTPLGLSISSPLSPAHPASGPTSPADQVPLSPRFYNPAPPPVPPNSSKPQFAKSNSNSNAGFSTNHTRNLTNLTTTSNTSHGSRRANPPTLNLHSASPIGNSPAGGRSSSSLPFRDAYPALLSAPPTKTTILERPEKLSNGPRTGLPTPYSPYMPFTPLTPLTPSRVVTKKQRKQLGRENGLRALNEEDAVKGEEDMWGY